MGRRKMEEREDEESDARDGERRWRERERERERESPGTPGLDTCRQWKESVANICGRAFKQHPASKVA